MAQIDFQEIDRRGFLKRASVALAGLSVVGIGANGLACSSARNPALAVVPSEGIKPGNLSWQTTITSKDEPGEPLVVWGRIFGPDGKTPLPDITLYVYHTDARGIYSDQKYDGRGTAPTPRLRGWMRTDALGRYEFRTIKPASYPDHAVPAHIHSSASGEGFKERWLDSFLFEGDPFITAEERAKFAGRGSFSPIMAIKPDSDGVLRCTRDIRLEPI